MKQNKGIAQVAIMIIMVVLAIALPITTKLVQKSQENRGKAAGGCYYELTLLSPNMSGNCPSGQYCKKESISSDMGPKTVYGTCAPLLTTGASCTAFDLCVSTDKCGNTGTCVPKTATCHYNDQGRTVDYSVGEKMSGYLTVDPFLLDYVSYTTEQNKEYSCTSSGWSASGGTVIDAECVGHADSTGFCSGTTYLRCELGKVAYRLADAAACKTATGCTASNCSTCTTESACKAAPCAWYNTTTKKGCYSFGTDSGCTSLSTSAVTASCEISCTGGEVRTGLCLSGSSFYGKTCCLKSSGTGGGTASTCASPAVCYTTKVGTTPAIPSTCSGYDSYYPGFSYVSGGTCTGGICCIKKDMCTDLAKCDGGTACGQNTGTGWYCDCAGSNSGVNASRVCTSKCSTGYHLSGTSCVADTVAQTCTDLKGSCFKPEESVNGSGTFNVTTCAGLTTKYQSKDGRSFSNLDGTCTTTGAFCCKVTQGTTPCVPNGTKACSPDCPTACGLAASTIFTCTDSCNKPTTKSCSATAACSTTSCTGFDGQKSCVGGNQYKACSGGQWSTAQSCPAAFPACSTGANGAEVCGKVTFSGLTATGIVNVRATINGSMVFTGVVGVFGKYYFEYGISDFSNKTVVRDIESTNSMTVSELITGLTALTKYQFRLVALDSNGNKYYSDTASFTTTNVAPTQICTPSTFECVEGSKIKGCDSTGTQWSTPVACPSGQCANRACVPPTTSVNCMVCPNGKSRTSGDANCDGSVDGLDYSIWRQEAIDHTKSTLSGVNGWWASFNCVESDSNSDTWVTRITDYTTWKSTYLP